MSAIRHSLPLEDMPAGDLSLSPTPLAVTVWEAREFVAEAVPFGTLTETLSGHSPGDTATELEKILLELFELESRARKAAYMLERSARELPEMADLATDTAGDVLVHALFPASAVAAGGR